MCYVLSVILDPARRLSYIIRSVKKLPAWRDDRVFRASITGNIYRIEFLGLAGIGKSFFNNKLTQTLGEKALKPEGVREQTDDYEAAFARVLRLQLDKSLPATEPRTVRLSWLRNFMQVMELDEFVSRNRIPNMFTSSSGLVHWTRTAMMDLVREEPETVKTVMSGRLTVYCSSNEPGRRSTQGLVKRGSVASGQLNEAVISRRNNEDQALGDLASSFETLGLPVVRLNLDLPFQENLFTLCGQLEKAGVNSGKISRLLGR